MTMNQDIRELFAGHAASDEEHFKQIAKDIQELKDLIKGNSDTMKPMTDSYMAASKLGKWGMAGLVFISVVIGIYFSLRAGFTK
jgi:hypothetical protein